MGLLSDQKKLQKKFYEQQEQGGGAKKTTPKKEKKSAPKKQPSKGVIASAKDIKAYNEMVKADMATYKGLAIEDKLPIKAALIKKYKEHVDWVLSAACTDYSLAVNGYAIWLFDTGDIEGFLDIVDRAIDIAQKQKIISKKDYQILKLYWIMDWAAVQRDQGLSYEPYFSRVFKSVKDWKLPKKIREGYWYFMFYSLIDQGKLKEAAKIGRDALGHGAEIKGNFTILQNILAGKYKKTWDSSQRKFINA